MKNKKMKKILAGLLAATMTISMCACGGGEDSGAPAKEESKESGESKEEKKTLTVWTCAASTEEKQVVEDFKKAYPEVDVQFTHYNSQDLITQVSLAVDSGTAPDIFQVNAGSRFQDFYEAGALMDITQIVEDYNLLERTNPDYAKPYMVDGKYFAFPTQPLTTWQTLYINRDLFEQAGITEDPKNISELIEVCDKLNAAGIAPIAMGDKDGWPAILMVGDFFAQQVTDTSICDAIKAGTDKFTTNPEIRKAFETVAELGKAGAFMPGFASQDHTTGIQTFAAGKTAMLYNGSWWVGITGGTDLGFNLDVISLPLMDGLDECKSVQLASDMGFVINSKSDNVEEAAKFLEYYTREEVSIKQAENSAAFAVFPGANEKVELDPAFKKEAILGQFDKPALSPLFDWMFPTSVTEVFKVVLQQAAEGKITVDDALSQLQVEMDKVIAEQ